MRRLILAAALLSALPVTALAGHKHGWKHKHERWDDDEGYHRGVYYYRIPTADGSVFGDYYYGRPLPPGLRKKLYRQGYLPPGWERKIRPVPVIVEQRLAPIPYGCRRGIFDDYYVVYQPRGGVIVDVMAIVGR